MTASRRQPAETAEPLQPQTHRDHLERAVMDTLWRRGEAMTAADIVAAMPRRSLAVTTVLTILERLRRKGLVERDRVGRGYAHRPTRSREELTAATMLTVLSDTTDRSLALARFVARARPDDVTALRLALGSSHELGQSFGRATSGDDARRCAVPPGQDGCGTDGRTCRCCTCGPDCDCCRSPQ